MTPLQRSQIGPLTIMFTVFMGLLFVFGWGITANANRLKGSVYDSCMSRSLITQQSNQLLDQLIINAQKSTAFTEVEKADRIAGWKAVRHQPESCVKS